MLYRRLLSWRKAQRENSPKTARREQSNNSTEREQSHQSTHREQSHHSTQGTVPPPCLSTSSQLSQAAAASPGTAAPQTAPPHLPKDTAGKQETPSDHAHSPTPPAPGTAPQTHRSGVGEVRGGVTDDAIAEQTVTREQAAAADRGHQDLGALRKHPLHRHIAQDRCHRLLQ